MESARNRLGWQCFDEAGGQAVCARERGLRMGVVFHADDYGITVAQARDILGLVGPLRSVSAFANSPAFFEAAELARPYVQEGVLRVGVHLNLVEGPCCADAGKLPLLVDGRGMFRHDFVGLWRLACGPQGAELRRQAAVECTAQIRRFLEAFPDERGRLRADSHQHPHAIPAVFDAVLDAVRACGCTLSQLRMPVEALGPHVRRGGVGRLLSLNLAKDALLWWLSRANWAKVPQGCATPAFCGVVLSGRMERLDEGTLQALEARAARQGRDLEVLFHPVSVPVAECLDPQNLPFAQACAASGRDAEAAWLRARR